LIRRILLVVDSLFPLGDAYQMKILARGLVRQHKVAVCVLDSGLGSNLDSDDGLSSAPDSAFFRALDIPIHFLGAGQKLKHRTHAAKVQTALRLRKRMRAFGPDIVHAFGQSSTHMAAAVLLKNDKTQLFSSVLSKWKPHTTPTKRLEGCLVNRVDRFIVAHECLQNEFHRFDVSDGKFSFVTNGVWVGESDATTAVGAAGFPCDRQHGRALLLEKTGLDPTSLIALTAADLEPVTRLKDLIWATDLLSCVRDDMHLVILGKGSQHQNLLKFAACTEAADHIHFLGLPEAALKMVAGADVYWNSHLQTPVPSGVLAAMNCSVPVISVYGPETAPLVIHQETGFAVNVGARDEFARWMKFLIEKRDAAKQLGSQGRRHCRHQFRANKMVRMIEKIYGQ
jgi:glycosyltransferase involved in cell wall biosynthesis